MRPEKGRLIKVVRGLCPPNPPGIFRMGAYRKDDNRKDDNPKVIVLPYKPPGTALRLRPAEPYPPTRQHQTTNHCSTCKENDNINHQPTTMCHNLI